MGATNDTHAEIITGVHEGDDVLLLQPGQGRGLLEKAGIKVQPTTRPGDLPNKPKREKRQATGAKAEGVALGKAKT